jgi:4-hydroxy-tetrahydrodipicolinate reductase
MNIAIIGYGKMGKMIEQAAKEAGHSIVTIVDPFVDESAVPQGICLCRNIAEAENIGSADAAIEFTRPETALANIKLLAERKIPAVTGTTGWYEHLREAVQAVEAAGSSLIWASNFSIGVNLFYRIAWHAAELFNSFPEFDVGGFEAHHNKKLDSPSGTAKTLAEGVIGRIERKNTIVYETLNRRPKADELHFPSLRLGSVPGQHSLFFDSPADTIEISHNARNREGFAAGAIRAAEWLAKSKRRGVFTIDDMLKEILEKQGVFINTSC